MMTEEEGQFIQMDGFEVRAWTSTQLMQLSPTLEKLVSLFLEKNISLSGLFDLSNDPQKLMGTFFEFLPLFPNIVSISLGVEEQEVKNWPFDKLFRLIMIVMVVNATKIKEFILLLNTTLKSFGKPIFN